MESQIISHETETKYMQFGFYPNTLAIGIATTKNRMFGIDMYKRVTIFNLLWFSFALCKKRKPSYGN